MLSLGKLLQRAALISGAIGPLSPLLASPHREIQRRASTQAVGSPPYRAYLADMFGTQFVGAIHGRLLTAWSTAGIIGPTVVNYIREFQLAAGVPRDQLYNTTMYVLCGMLVIDLICNYLVKPVDPKWYMSQEEVAKLQAANAKAAATTPSGSFGIGKGGLDLQAAIFWAFVGIPLAWGIWITFSHATRIFLSAS